MAENRHWELGFGKGVFRNGCLGFFNILKKNGNERRGAKIKKSGKVRIGKKEGEHDISREVSSPNDINQKENGKRQGEITAGYHREARTLHWDSKPQKQRYLQDWGI